MAHPSIKMHDPHPLPPVSIAGQSASALIAFLFALVLAMPRVHAEEHPVQAQLLADVEAVEAGSPFRLGVHLRMDENWHTYWAFSGDAGQPTRVDWTLPEGFEAGPLQWPLPHKYEEAGGLTVYGYADEVMLLTRVQVPQSLPPGPLRVRAEVSWLVCRELCIPGDTTLVLDLHTGAARPAHAALFARYTEQIPGALQEGTWSQRARRGTEDYVVDVELGGTALQALDFYPLHEQGFQHFRTERRGRGLRLTLRPYGGDEVDLLRGVLVYQVQGEERRRSGEVALDLAGAETLSLLERDFQGAAGGQARSVWTYLLLAAVGGLILNLMPCVLPVISLKVLSIVSQSGQAPARVRQLGLAFAAGIVVAFLVLALVVVLLKAGGEQIGWGFQFQYPGFVMGMAALVFALGLSLFGVFTLNLTGGGGALGELADRGGLGGSFFNGVLATVLATPCTAPFLGTALGFAFAQPGPVVWSIFAAIGAGMALPYVLLALQPGWMRFLPRPGAWMERFKQLMGFLLMATVLWLLWVLGKQVGVEGVIWTGSFLLCVGLACWIVGQFVDLRATRPHRLGAWAAALVVLVAAYALFLEPLLEVEEALAGEREPAAGTLDWEPFSVQRVEELIAGGRMVFIDFTAEWCWTCKVNERTVLARPEVRDKFAELDVALVKADWTNRNPQITEMLRAFGRSGVPLYVIFAPGQVQNPIVLPEVITPGLVLEKLEEAARAGGL